MSEYLSHENKSLASLASLAMGKGETASGYLKMDRKLIEARNNATICISPSKDGAQFSQNAKSLAKLAKPAKNAISWPEDSPREQGGVWLNLAKVAKNSHPAVQYCSGGQHVWYPRCEGDGGMLQCAKCPQVQAAPAADNPRHPAVHDPLCVGGGLTVHPGVGWNCSDCQQQYRAPIIPTGVLHLWSELLQDDVYGIDSQAKARELWAPHRIAVDTPGELRRLRQVERADPNGFPHKLQEIHRLKNTFGGTVDAVMIPPPQAQEISAADGADDLHREGGK
jgi:hypothetical protein